MAGALVKAEVLAVFAAARAEGPHFAFAIRIGAQLVAKLIEQASRRRLHRRYPDHIPVCLQGILARWYRQAPVTPIAGRARAGCAVPPLARCLRSSVSGNRARMAG